MSDVTVAETGSYAEAGASGRTVLSLPLAIAAVLGIAGSRLVLIGGRLALTGGILLLVGSLVGAGVAFGAGAPAHVREGTADLSTRLGLGLLGGLAAGLLHATLTVKVGWLGVAGLIGAGIDVELSALEWWNRAAIGAGLGIALGAVYPMLPGATFIRRGAFFGLLYAAWHLFYVYPFQMGLGAAGIDAGWGVPLVVIVGAVVAGVVAAWVVDWGGRVREEPLSAPLVS